MNHAMPGERYKPKQPEPPPGGGKVYGVYFHCIHQYVQARPMRGGTIHLATCPKCGKSVRIRVGEGGTNQRLFEASC